MSKVKYALIALFLLIGIGIVEFFILPNHKAMVTLVNRAGKVIKNAKVELCGQTGEANNILSEGSRNLTLKVTRDCAYQVNVTFESGEAIRNQVGYVTNGLDFDDQIIVSESEIKMGESKAR